MADGGDLKPGRVYVFGFDQYVKIGFSRDFRSRRRAIQENLPKKLEVYLTLPGSFEDERALHRKFAKHRLRGEWFLYTGALADWIAEQAGSLSSRRLKRRADNEPPYIYNPWDDDEELTPNEGALADG